MGLPGLAVRHMGPEHHTHRQIGMGVPDRGMLQTLDQILDTLQISGIIRHYNANRAVHYTGAKWLGNQQMIYNENCVYVGFASELTQALPSRNIGIVVVNDDGRDLSDIQVDLVELSPENDPARICLQIKEKFFSTYEISSISQTIIEKMLRTYSIKELIDFISEHMDNPVFINFHFENRCYYYSGDPAIERELRVLDEIRAHSPTKQLLDQVNRIWKSPLPMILEDGFCYEGKRRMQVPITDGVNSDKPIGILTAFEVRHDFTTMDTPFLAFMGYILSLKAGESGFQKDVFFQEYEQCLHDLIRGAQISSDLSWVNSLFGSKQRNYLVALADARSLSTITLEDTKNRLYQSVVFSTIIMRGSYLVMIANPAAQELPGFMARLEEAAASLGLVFGVSETFSDILRLQKHYTQAKRVREMCGLLGMDRGVFPFEKYKTGLLVKDIAASENPELFVDESIDRLIEHDRRENTDYLATLETYIRCGMSNEQTRRLLNIHRNTLTYRLNKIEEILGHSLNESDYLINLHFANVIRKYSQQKRFTEE